MKEKNMIKCVLVLAQGETPWQYSANPGEYPGPWASASEALTELEDPGAAGLVAGETWERDGVLWVESLGEEP
jgi:hypothetical protein